MKKIALLCLLISLGLYASAQSISVKSFKAMPTDMTASSLQGKRIDQNGEVAALIKIETSQTGFIFEGGTLGIVDTKQETGEIWVWVPRGLRKITIKHQQLGILRDYLFPVPIEAERTYQMILSTDRIETIVKPTLHQQYLVFQITPPNATLEVDDQLWEVDAEGGATKYMNFGTYSYRVQAPNYHIEAGQVTVNDPDNAKVVTVILQPNFGWIEVPAQGNLQGASVYVDNVLVGKAPCKSEALKSGQHTVRIAKEMYDSFSGTVTVNDNETTRFTPTLKANFAEITLKVDADAEIWVNNERKGIRSWTGPLGSGTYRVECKMANHEPSVTSQEITASMGGQTITLPSPTPICGALSVESTPALCTLMIDGVEVGTTPKFIPELLIGTHELKLTKKGYVGITQTFTIAQGERKELKLKLGTESTQMLIKKGDNFKLKEQYAEAMQCYQNALEMGDMTGQQRIGGMKLDGQGVEKDVQEGLRLYRDAAEKGCTDAAYLLGDMYFNGTPYVRRDLLEAMKWYRIAAERGDADAQRRLGYCYRNGDGVVKNADEAARWFKMALESFRKEAEQGKAESQESLAAMYNNGLGTARNDEEATRWYQEAIKTYRKEADEGFVYAMDHIGTIYDYGNGVEENNAEAAKWYMAAAEQKMNTYRDLGYLYYYGGHGLQQDYKQAMKWFVKAAEKEDHFAMEKLAEMYEKGEGVGKDSKKAQKYYDDSMEILLKKADEGDMYAMSSIGDRYKDGRGVKKDLKTASKWYMKSYENGYRYCLSKIGRMYEEEKDYSEALKWYRSGADKNDGNCQSYIGGMYRNGNGVPKDEDEAIKWYKKAIENGDQSSLISLGIIYKDQKNYSEALKYFKLFYETGSAYVMDEIASVYRSLGNYAEALAWYRKGAEKGQAWCQTELAKMYEKGEGVPVDKKEALKWYKKAVDNGYTFYQDKVDELSK